MQVKIVTVDGERRALVDGKTLLAPPALARAALEKARAIDEAAARAERLIRRLRAEQRELAAALEELRSGRPVKDLPPVEAPRAEA